MSDNDSSIELKVGNARLSVSGTPEFVKEHFYDLYEQHGFADVVESGVDIASEEGSNTRRKVEKGKKSEPRRDGRTLNEYLANSEASTKQDNALVTGWYLEKVEGQDDFIPSEVTEEGNASKVPLGANLKRDLDENVKKGNLHSPGERDNEDSYWITETGEKYLEELGIPVQHE